MENVIKEVLGVSKRFGPEEQPREQNQDIGDGHIHQKTDQAGGS